MPEEMCSMPKEYIWRLGLTQLDEFKWDPPLRHQNETSENPEFRALLALWSARKNILPVFHNSFRFYESPSETIDIPICISFTEFNDKVCL